MARRRPVSHSVFRRSDYMVAGSMANYGSTSRVFCSRDRMVLPSDSQPGSDPLGLAVSPSWNCRAVGSVPVDVRNYGLPVRHVDQVARLADRVCRLLSDNPMLGAGRSEAAFPAGAPLLRLRFERTFHPPIFHFARCHFLAISDRPWKPSDGSFHLSRRLFGFH